MLYGSLYEFEYCLCSCERLGAVERESVRQHKFKPHLPTRKDKPSPWQAQLEVAIFICQHVFQFCWQLAHGLFLLVYLCLLASLSGNSLLCIYLILIGC